MSAKEKVAIIGIGEVKTGIFPDRSGMETALLSSLEAIKNAGIDKNEIDCIMTTAALNGRYSYEIDLCTARMVEELGLGNKVKCNIEVFSGGSSSCDTLRTVVGLIAIGQVETALCIHTETLGTAGVERAEEILRNGAFSAEWEHPFGVNGIVYNDWMTQRYMHEYGATLEEIASVIVSNRKWGNMNPLAAFPELMTWEDIKATPKLSSLLTAGHFQTYLDGGCAFIVTSAKKAEKLKTKPVYVLGESSLVSRFLVTGDPDILIREAYARSAKEAFAQAGLTPRDMQFAELYECFAVVQLAAFEELGFAKRGEAAKFFTAGHAAPGGKFPVNTNGGLLVQGHTGAGGGYALLIEAVRQLKGQAGKRQIPNLTYGVYTGTGGAFANAAVTILGTEIPGKK